MKLKLRMTVDVEFETNGVEPDDLTENMRRVVQHAYAEGMFTGSTEAEMVKEPVVWVKEGTKE